MIVSRADRTRYVMTDLETAFDLEWTESCMSRHSRQTLPELCSFWLDPVLTRLVIQVNVNNVHQTRFKTC